MSVVANDRLVPPPDWPDRLKALGGPIMSCNPRGEVWACHGRGYMPEQDRKYVDGKDWFLDLVVSCVLRLRPAGGRFHILSGGVFLATDNMQVVEFTV